MLLQLGEQRGWRVFGLVSVCRSQAVGTIERIGRAQGPWALALGSRRRVRITVAVRAGIGDDEDLCALLSTGTRSRARVIRHGRPG